MVYMLAEERKKLQEKLQVIKKGVAGQMQGKSDHVGNGMRGFFTEGYCVGYCNAIDQVCELIGYDGE